MNSQDSSAIQPGNEERALDYARRHFRFGWSALFVFTVLGLGLELLHGFKVRAYLDVSNETRRLMWTLAHSHGTLLSIVNIVFALMLRGAPGCDSKKVRIGSICLLLATIFLPGGFFLGGLVVYGGDPGLGIVFVPLGAVFLLLTIYFVIRDRSLFRTAEKKERPRKA